ncbi:hypothetical protein SUDANB6_00064 [Streptomyces sp. enrichment culture]|uniref:hypothetical protein n=1 Tax=Streptomyces sp. enrichment culture TaxID=1795815 RepID=UPI003F56FC3C
MPTPPEGVVEAARLAPEHWISVVDDVEDGEDRFGANRDRLGGGAGSAGKELR